MEKFRFLPTVFLIIFICGCILQISNLCRINFSNYMVIYVNIFQSWKRYVKFKIAYHGCISLLYQGQQAEEQQKMGERVAFYHAAAEKLEEAVKLSKGMENIEVSVTLVFYIFL